MCKASIPSGAKDEEPPVGEDSIHEVSLLSEFTFITASKARGDRYSWVQDQFSAQFVENACQQTIVYIIILNVT